MIYPLERYCNSLFFSNLADKTVLGELGSWGSLWFPGYRRIAPPWLISQKDIDPHLEAHASVSAEES